MSDTEMVNRKATDLQIKQAIAKRKHRSEAVWLAHSTEEAEANAHLFAKAQIPLGTKDRNRGLSKAFNRAITARGNRT
jgi:hypothetical protein